MPWRASAPRNVELESECDGVRIALAGLTQGLAVMPADCGSSRALGPLVPYLEERISALEGSAVDYQQRR